MLYAARAALSEENQNAKTHRGTWGLFHAAFVSSGRFERELHEHAQRARQLRDEADYEAGGASADEARVIIAAAERFVRAVAALLAS